VRGKPHATGIKFWVSADQDGVINHLILYEGKKKTGEIKTLDLILKMVDFLPKENLYYIFCNFKHVTIVSMVSGSTITLLYI
jgi:hypothetical protein